MWLHHSMSIWKYIRNNSILFLHIARLGAFDTQVLQHCSEHFEAIRNKIQTNDIYEYVFGKHLHTFWKCSWFNILLLEIMKNETVKCAASKLLSDFISKYNKLKAIVLQSTKVKYLDKNSVSLSFSLSVHLLVLSCTFTVIENCKYWIIINKTRPIYTNCELCIPGVEEREKLFLKSSC